MAIKYNVKAEVVDINSDKPEASDVFLVDTNVWYWMTYTPASQRLRPPMNYQMSDYPRYVNAANAADARVCWCGLSIAEISHQIERIHQEIYESWVTSIDLKEYRHKLPAERSRVISDIQASWAMVKSLAVPISLTVDEATTEAALDRLQNVQVDGYDLFILEAMRTHNVIQLITDDGDFSTVPGIQVFTANRNVINTACAQGKLLTR